MGFWDSVGDLAAKGIKKAGDMANEKMDNYNNTYDKYSDRYTNMSDDDLRFEIERLKRQTDGEMFKRMGRLQAMKDELDRRKSR